MKGGIGWNLRISGIGWDIWAFYLMFLFWEIDMKLCKDFTKTYKCKILYKIRIVLNRSYSTNTQPFWKRRYHRGARETHVCSYYYLNLIIFHFFKDIIDNTIYASGTCHQNSNQLQRSIIATNLCLYHMNRILHCH